jgi:hypothetical protein
MFRRFSPNFKVDTRSAQFQQTEPLTGNQPPAVRLNQNPGRPLHEKAINLLGNAPSTALVDNLNQF